jgi:hypothetical protein
MLTLPKRVPWFPLGALATISLVAIVGCGRAPSAPNVASGPPDTYTSPVFVQVPRAGDATGAVPTGIQSGEAPIDGAIGGEIQVGRFTVVVPAGAFVGTATIHVTVPDPNVVACELEISPASANGFTLPVDLRANCAGATNVDLAQCGTLWYDEANGVWRTVSGTAVDLEAQTVTASLWHFSTYGVADLLSGKASW